VCLLQQDAGLGVQRRRFRIRKPEGAGVKALHALHEGAEAHVHLPAPNPTSACLRAEAFTTQISKPAPTVLNSTIWRFTKALQAPLAAQMTERTLSPGTWCAWLSMLPSAVAPAGSGQHGLAATSCTGNKQKIARLQRRAIFCLLPVPSLISKITDPKQHRNHTHFGAESGA